MRLPFTNQQLVKIAAVGGLFVGGNVLLMHYLVKQRFYNSPYFTQAVGTVLNHKPLVNYLGEPISFGNPDLGDSVRNYSTLTEAKFDVSVKGSKTKGRMKFTAIREVDGVDDDKSALWSLTNLEIVVHDRPREKVVLVNKERQTDIASFVMEQS